MNASTLMNPGHIALWVLVIGLFFPRLSLFAAWISTGAYPSNDVPWVVNFFLLALLSPIPDGLLHLLGSGTPFFLVLGLPGNRNHGVVR